MSRKYTLQEIAKNLQVSYVTIWREVRDGHLFARKPRGAKHLLVCELELKRYLAANQVTPCELTTDSQFAILFPRCEFVYVFQWKHYYKLGRTLDLEGRLSAFNDNLPEPLDIPVRLIKSWSVRNYVAVERWLHAEFAPYRVYGEWFTLPADALERLLSLTTEDLIALAGGRRQ